MAGSSNSDLLTVSVVTARGLSLPSGKTLQTDAKRAQGSDPSQPKRTLRQRQALLPYVVLEFDKNEVLILASGGDLTSPQWQFTANLYVPFSPDPATSRTRPK